MLHFNKSTPLSATNITLPTWDEILTESFHPKSSLLTFFQILLYVIPVVLLIVIFRCLNNTKTCSAMKGATLNKVTHVSAGARRWIHKRSTDFDTFRDPPKQFDPYSQDSEYSPMRPVQASAYAHHTLPRTARTPFTSDHYQSQQRVNNYRYASQYLHPLQNTATDTYATMEAGLTPNPPAYSSPNIIKTPPAQHKYNTRSQSKQPEVRKQTTSLPQPPATVAFEIK
jgi:hypothetical protein